MDPLLYIVPNYQQLGQFQNRAIFLPIVRIARYMKIIPANPRVIMMPILLSLEALKVVMTTTSSATSDDKIGMVTTLNFLSCEELPITESTPKLINSWVIGVSHEWISSTGIWKYQEFITLLMAGYTTTQLASRAWFSSDHGQGNGTLHTYSIRVHNQASTASCLNKYGISQGHVPMNSYESQAKYVIIIMYNTLCFSFHRVEIIQQIKYSGLSVKFI